MSFCCASELSARAWSWSSVTLGGWSAFLSVVGRWFLKEAAEGVNYVSLKIIKTIYIYSATAASLLQIRCEMQAGWKESQ